MGIFNKLKKAANFLTGGGAEVELNIADGNITDPINAQINIKVGEGELNVQNIYMLLKCTEITKTVVESEDGEEIEENENFIYDEKIEIAGNQVLESEKEYLFTKEINLPEDAEGSLVEDNREVSWEFQAGIDIKGNDPDSGWIKVNLIK